MKLPIKQTVTESLTQTLSSGNSTSGNPISISNGDYVEFVSSTSAATTGQLRVSQTFSIVGQNTSAANRELINWSSNTFTLGISSQATVLNGSSVVINGLTWPSADGSNGHVLTTNGGGTLSFTSLSSFSETLSQTLALGDTTSGQHITISNGDYLEFPGTGAASTTGQFRIADGFNLTGRDSIAANRILIDWSSDVFSIGNLNHVTVLDGYEISVQSNIDMNTNDILDVGDNVSFDISSTPLITQEIATSGAGANMRIQAQSTTVFGQPGGRLELTGGGSPESSSIVAIMSNETDVATFSSLRINFYEVLDMNGGSIDDIGSLTGAAAPIDVFSNFDLNNNSITGINSLSGNSAAIVINNDFNLSGNDIDNIGALSGNSATISIENDINLNTNDIHGARTINISRAAGNNRDLTYQSGGTARWAIRTNSTAEGGSNAGSDLEIIAFDDAGSTLGTAISIVRSSQEIDIGGTLDLNSNVVVGASSYYTQGTSPRLDIYETGEATDEGRWRLIAGSSDLVLQTRTDADGTGIDVLTFQRGTGTACTAIVAGTDLNMNGNNIEGAVEVEGDRLTGSGVLSDTFATTEADYDIGDVTHLRVTTTSPGSIVGGFTGGTQGRTLYVTNLGSSSLVVVNEGGGSTAANRIHTSTGGNITLEQDDTLLLIYDGTSSRWRNVGL